MNVIGIDLSGPKNIVDTCLTVFEARDEALKFARAIEGAGDRQIFEMVSGLSGAGRTVVGIDAPLSYNPGGGDRDSDRALRQLVREKGGGAGVMPPTMIRMVYLTLRGIALTRMLAALENPPEIVEVHPGASLLLRNAPAADVRHFRNDPPARANLCAWLETQGLKGLPAAEVTSHFVAACGAALAAWRWAHRDAAWCHPAQPPLHPYDFAC
jgi:predicted nuclease with RNAse H fold